MKLLCWTCIDCHQAHLWRDYLYRRRPDSRWRRHLRCVHCARRGPST